MVQMRRLLVSIALIFAACLILAPSGRAVDLATLLENKEGPDTFKLIHVADLAKLMANPGAKLWIMDANYPELRDKAGVIPGAHLLSSHKDYDVKTELPADKSTKLIFYCADLH